MRTPGTLKMTRPAKWHRFHQDRMSVVKLRCQCTQSVNGDRRDCVSGRPGLPSNLSHPTTPSGQTRTCSGGVGRVTTDVANSARFSRNGSRLHPESASPRKSSPKRQAQPDQSVTAAAANFASIQTDHVPAARSFPSTALPASAISVVESTRQSGLEQS